MMRMIFPMSALSLALYSVFSLTVQAAEATTPPTSDQDKLSYSVGHNVGKSLAQEKMDLNLELFKRGMEDAMGGAAGLMNEQEISKTLLEYKKARFMAQSQQQAADAEKNLKAGESFLAENAKKPGVTTLPSGLQYKEITAGTGAMPTAEDSVVAHYRGTLIDGTEFDSSYSRGEPATFQVKGVIKGWQEVLQLMKTGAKWQIFVPAALGYGQAGAGGKIGPNQVLIFDVELLSVAPKAVEPKADAKPAQ